MPGYPFDGRKTASVFASDAPSVTGALQLRHTSENALFPGKQFIGTSFLGDFTVRKHHDMIGSLHGAHAMRDDQDGLSRQEPRQRALDFRFIFHIERCSSLIQKNDGRVFQQRTGDGDALPFAAS